MGSVLEDAIREIMPELRAANAVKVLPTKYYRWWHKGEEIDLAVVGDVRRGSLRLSGDPSQLGALGRFWIT